MSDDPQTLVSTAWLAARLKAPDLRVIDGSWHLPSSDRNPRLEYDAAHIPGARFFDIEKISDARSSLPHMAPSAEKFMSRMRQLGIGDGHQVVVYDGSGIFSAARVWWLFRLMGHKNVAVLDGGLPKWLADGYAVTDIQPSVKERHFTARFQGHLVRDVTAVSRASKLKTPQIVDARPSARYRGETPEPRPGMRAGHIPGSWNLPYSALLNSDGTMKPVDACRTAFEAVGMDLTKPIITSCGSGVTAAILALALERIGHRNWSLYDGSWAEWGASPIVPVATGET